MDILEMDIGRPYLGWAVNLHITGSYLVHLVALFSHFCPSLINAVMKVSHFWSTDS